MSEQPRRSGNGPGRSLWAARKFLIPNVSKVVGVAGIRDGYRLIRSLWDEVQVARAAGRALAEPAHVILSSDLATEAALRGLSPQELDTQIQRRRAETKRAVLFGGLLSVIAFGGWSWNMVMSGPTGVGWFATSLMFLPFGGAALLHAFYNGWMNWQLRRGRRGTAMEYLATDEGFWPS